MERKIIKNEVKNRNQSHRAKVKRNLIKAPAKEVEVEVPKESKNFRRIRNEKRNAGQSGTSSGSGKPKVEEARSLENSGGATLGNCSKEDKSEEQVVKSRFKDSSRVSKVSQSSVKDNSKVSKVIQDSIERSSEASKVSQDSVKDIRVKDISKFSGQDSITDNSKVSGQAMVRDIVKVGGANVNDASEDIVKDNCEVRVKSIGVGQESILE